MLKKQVAFFLIVALLLTSLTGCTLFASIAVENGFPVASGFKNSEEINAAFTEFYGEIDKVLNEKCGDAQIVYTSSKTDSGFVISSQITRDGITVDIPAFTVAKSGVITAPDEASVKFLGDGDFIDSTLRIKKHGMDIDTSKYGDEIMSKDIYSTLLAYYDCFDADDHVSHELPFDERLYKLKLSDYTNSSEDEFTVIETAAPAYMQNLISAMLTNVYGYSSSEATCEDVLKQCELSFALKSYIKPDFEPAAAEFIENARSYLEKIELLDAAASRIALAEAFVEAYEKKFGEIKLNDDFYGFSDTSSKHAKRAYQTGLMFEFPINSGLFSSGYVIHDGEAVDVAFNVEATVFSAAREVQEQEGNLVYGRLICLLGIVDEHFSALERCMDAPTIIDNGGDNDWYVTQMDDSEYSAINCMPSITSMGIKWYYGESDVNSALLREKYSDGNMDGGWYMYQVENCLDIYDVPYSVVDNISIQAMTEALDRGSIILTQMSEAAPDQSGHCFIIYGYRKFGESTIFYLNDPQSIDLKGKSVDGAYVNFIVGRYTGSFVEINKS